MSEQSNINCVESLAIFDASEVAWNGQAYRQMAEMTHFVRPVRILANIAAQYSLETILSRTEQEFLKIAQYTGAQIVPHLWGMVEKPLDCTILDTNERMTHTHPDLPKNLLIAARVETIRSCGPKESKEFLRLQTGIRRYAQSRQHGHEETPIHLTDATMLRNYSKGATLSISNPSIILHDIEPLITIY